MGDVRSVQDVQAAVRERVEGAEIVREPFPHLVVPDLLPPELFRELAGAIPPLELFEPRQSEIKADLPLGEKNRYFAAAPEPFRTSWRVLRDDVLGATIAPILARRLEDDIRRKYAALFDEEVADRIMAGGLVGSNGRIMARKPGYLLRPHLDSAHFAVTCLLYFSAGEDESSGAFCLYRPDRALEVKSVSTYYPEREEGAVAQLARSIPIRENLFVAFLNRADSLHGARVETTADVGLRISYQAHVLPRHDIRKDVEEFVDRLPDRSRGRWQRYAAQRRAKDAAKKQR